MLSFSQFEIDVIPTSMGDLELIFLGHGSLGIIFVGKTIYVDPFSRVADYSGFPSADMILITHEHSDHLDLEAIAHVRTEKTQIVLTKACDQQIAGGIVIQNGDRQIVCEIPIEAIAAYNIEHKRDNGQPFHPQGQGNGYILSLGDKHVYIAGDTENIPEMKDIQDIECAFLPMNLPYTMTPEMVASAAKTFRPHLLYPYHYGNTDISQLMDLFSAERHRSTHSQDGVKAKKTGRQPTGLHSHNHRLHADLWDSAIMAQNKSELLTAELT